MANDEIGGIAVTIDANIGPLMQKVDAANSAIGNLQNQTIEISAVADTASARRAAAQLKAEINRLKTSESPIPVRFKFDSSRGAVRQLRESASKELTKQGGVETELKPVANAAKLLVDTLGPVVVPVAFVWNNQWAGGAPPTVEVNVRGKGGGGGDVGGGGGGGTTGGGSVTRQRPPSTGGGGGAVVSEAATTGRVTGAATTAPSARAGVILNTCSTCGEQYPKGTWNQHQQTTTHRNARTQHKLQQEVQAAEAVVAQPQAGGRGATFVPSGRGPQYMQQARVTGERGITRREIEPEVAELRAQLAEQRDLGIQPVMAFGAQAETILGQLGLDIAAARTGTFRPRANLSAAEQEAFYEKFPHLRAGPAIPLTGREGRRTRARMASRQRLEDRFRKAQFAGPRSSDPSSQRFARRMGMQPSEEFNQLIQFVEKQFQMDEEGNLSPLGTRLKLPEEYGGVEPLFALMEEGIESGELPMIGEAVQEAFGVRRGIVDILNKRSVAKRLRKAAELRAAGVEVPEGFEGGASLRGTRRKKRLTGEGRKVSGRLGGAADLGILATTSVAKRGIREFTTVGENEAAADIAAQAQATREFNEALGVAPSAPVQRVARAIPGQEKASLRQELVGIQDRIESLSGEMAGGAMTEENKSTMLKLIDRQMAIEETLKAASKQGTTNPLKPSGQKAEDIRMEEATRRYKARRQQITEEEARRAQGIQPEPTGKPTFRASEVPSLPRPSSLSRLSGPGPTIPEFAKGTQHVGAAEELAALQADIRRKQQHASEVGRYAAMVRWHGGDSGAGGAGGGAGGAALGGAVPAGHVVPVQVMNVPLQVQVAGSGGSVAAGEPLKPFKGGRAEREKMLAPGTPRVAGGINIETGEKEEETTAERARSAGLGGIKSILDVADVEDISESVRKNVDAFKDISNEARVFASQVVQENPVRALSVAVGQVLVNTLGGRSGLIKRQKELDREAGELDKAATLYGRALERQGQVAKRITDIEDGAAERFVGEADRLRELQPRLERVTERRQQTAQTQQAEVERLRGGIQQERFRRGALTLGVGTVGIVGGTFLFQAAMAAFNLAVEQISIGLGRATASLSDFEQKTGEIATAMGQATREQFGNVQAVSAGTLAQAGFGPVTAGRIRPNLEARALAIGGTQAFEQQLDLIRASRNIGRGIEGGVDVRALTETTGGFPILNIGGQRSIRELISGELGRTGRTLGLGTGPSAVSLRPGGAFGAGQSGDVANAMKDLKENISWWNENARRGGSNFQLAAGSAEEVARQTKLLSEAPWEGADELAQRLADNATVLKGATSQQDFVNFLQGVAAGGTTPDPQLLAEQTARQLRAQIGGRQQQGILQRQTILPAQQFLGQLANPLIPFQQTIAARTPGADQSVAYDKAKASIDAAQQSLSAYADEGEKAAMATIQAADAVSGGNLAGAWQTATTAVAAYGKQIQALQQESMWAQVNLQVAQYDEQLRVANRSLADAQEFLTGIDAAGNDNLGLLERQSLMYSRQSAQIGFQQQALGLQSAQLGIQNQRLSIRSRELGFQTTQLSRQSQLLGFQSTQLSLQQQQRQINFQTAIAGFTTPGLTPAERAARIDEAKKEAEVAQKQHDIAEKQFIIAKQIFGIEGEQVNIALKSFEIDKAQFELQRQQVALSRQAYEISVAAYGVQQQIVDLNAARAVEDLQRQIALIQKAREVTITVALNQEAIDNLQKVMNKEIEQAQAVLDEAVDIRQQVISAQVQIAAQLGGAVASYGMAVLKALGLGMQQINAYLGRSLQNYVRIGESFVPSVGGHQEMYQGGTYAVGMLGQVASTTRMIVGEAGPETVAILRNPRNVDIGNLGGGGGMTTINIAVTGNNINNEADEERLAQRIAYQVERIIGQRASQQGFRFAAR